MYDVAIVGAGPAGSAAALRLLQRRPSARVVLLDSHDFPRNKVCGDGIAAHVLTALADLGVPAPDAPDVPGLRLRTPSGRVVHGPCAAPNRVIRRVEFDAALVAAAVERGAELRRHKVRRVSASASAVDVDGVLSAAVVIGADGANSVVRRSLAAPPSPRSTVAVAIRGYAPTQVDPSSLVIEFAKARVPAYGWSFPLADGGANVGYGVLGRGEATRASLLAGLSATLPGVEPDPATLRGHQLPLSTGPRFQPDGRVLLAGDAASLVNPLTGEGIYYAVVSGALAAEAALRGADAGAAYRSALRARFGRHHRHTGALSRLVGHGRFLDAAVVASARHRSVFDAAIDLGLGAGTAPVGALARVLASYVTGARQPSDVT